MSQSDIPPPADPTDPALDAPADPSKTVSPAIAAAATVDPVATAAEQAATTGPTDPKPSADIPLAGTTVGNAPPPALDPPPQPQDLAPDGGSPTDTPLADVSGPAPDIPELPTVSAGNPDTPPNQGDAADAVPGIPPASTPKDEPYSPQPEAPVSLPAAGATAGTRDASKANLPQEAVDQLVAISSAEVAAGDLHARNAENAVKIAAAQPPNAASSPAVRPIVLPSEDPPMSASPEPVPPETPPEESPSDPKAEALTLLKEAAQALHGTIDTIFEKGDADIEPLSEKLRVGGEAIATQLGGTSPILKPYIGLILGVADPYMKNVETELDAKAHAALALFQARIEALPFLHLNST